MIITITNGSNLFLVPRTENECIRAWMADMNKLSFLHKSHLLKCERKNETLFKLYKNVSSSCSVKARTLVSSIRERKRLVKLVSHFGLYVSYFGNKCLWGIGICSTFLVWLFSPIRVSIGFTQFMSIFENFPFLQKAQAFVLYGDSKWHHMWINRHQLYLRSIHCLMFNMATISGFDCETLRLEANASLNLHHKMNSVSV